MYLNKAREHLATRDKRILLKKREKYEERELQKSGAAAVSESKREPLYEELPLVLEIRKKDEEVVVYPSEYLGSYPLKGHDDKDLRQEAKEKMIEAKKSNRRTFHVILIVSTEGIVIADTEGKKVYNSHAIHRISYASGSAENLMFCYIAREANEIRQYCHAFTMGSRERTENLQKAFERVFRKAFIKQSKQKRISSIVEEQVKVHLEKFKKLYQERKMESSGKEGNTSNSHSNPFRHDKDYVIDPCGLPSYFPMMSQDEAIEVLEDETFGAFIIRDSSRFPGSFSLSVKVPNDDSETEGRVANYLIIRNDHGVQLHNSKKSYKSVNTLIKHLSKESDSLPCILHLPRINVNSVLAGFNVHH